MSPSQKALYWREWGRTVSTCKQEGWPAPDRHVLHVQALGCDKSSKALTNDDLDRVLAAFRAVSRPDDLVAQLRQQDQPRRRLLYSIRRLAPEAYRRAICRDKFGTVDLDRLDLVQLRQLRITLGARACSRMSRDAAAAAA